MTARPAGDAPRRTGLVPPRIDQAPRPAPPRIISPGTPVVLRARSLILSGTVGSGLFVYSPTPGPGNLIGSWASEAGVDPFGNAYPAGLSSEQGNISGTTITASAFQGFNFVIDNNGIRLYETAPTPPPPPPPPPAAPVPYKIGHGTFGTATPQIISVATATAAGDTIYVAANAAAGGATVTGVTDSKGNSYAPGPADATQIPTSVWTATGATAALSPPVGGGLGDTISVAYTSTTGQKCATALGIRGLPSSPADQAVSAAGNSGNPQVTSGALAEATEIVLVAFGTAFGGGNPNLGAGLAVADQLEKNNSQYLTIGYQALASAAAFTAGATISADKWAALLTTFKEV